jgi:hypothetical protein
MTEFSAGRIEPQLSKRPDFSGAPLLSVRNAGKSWNFIPLGPGLIGSLFALNLYPLLEGRYLLMGVVFLFFLMTAVMPRASVFSGIALGLLAAALLMNGALDRFPPAEVRTTVIRKAVTTVKGTKYHVVVSSWQPGQSEQEFDPGVFRRATVGKTVTVEVHKGFCGLPWSGNIAPE